MPFSRYQIRNEFSLADPELYKAADKDDPEALLEGVAMAGLVGVLRQLGDLAEFAAEIFHGLHEEVMVTATRGHGLLVRVQQLESDFPSIERAFLSQTGHSEFFSSPGIAWHPNIQTDQNLITKGDLPRFVMDSYEECRGPPRLFLLDKFDVAGAGACLKRYTDPSFYKVETTPFEVQRDKKVRKTKKKGSRETPEVFQSSHVKLHQLLQEERMQNGTSEPTRLVKLKKREMKFPFDTETGKGYMEKLLSPPPEDKLVHEVPGLETLEGSMVGSPMQNGSPFESKSVDKMVNMPENVPENQNVPEVFSDEEVEEKHMSVDRDHKTDSIISNGYQSDDVASEGENYVDALATMESEIETDVELRASSDPNVGQIQSQSSDDEIESGLIRKKTSFSDSDTSTASAGDVNSSQAFASTEIPFRPRVSSQIDQMEPELSEMASNNCVEVNNLKSQIEPQAIDDPSSSNHQSEDGNSDSTLVNSHVEEQTFGPSLEEVDICEAELNPSEEGLLRDDDVLENKSDGVSYSSEDETEFKDDSNKDDNLSVLEDGKELKETEPELVIPETKDDIDGNEIQGISNCEDSEIETLTDEKHEENGVSTTEESGENGPVIEELGVIQSSNESDGNSDSDESVGKKDSIEGIKVESINLETEDVAVEKDEDNGVSTTEESGENGVVQSSDVGKMELSEESLICPVLDFIPSESYDHSNIEFLDNPSAQKELSESGEEKELIKESLIPPESDSIPSENYDHSNIQLLDSPSAKKLFTESGEEESSKESLIPPESDSIPSENYDHSNVQLLNNPSANKELTESGEEKESLIPPESDSIPSEYSDHSNIQILDNPSEKKELTESGEKKESSSSNESLISLELDPIPSANYHLSNNIQVFDNPSEEKDSTKSDEEEETNISAELNSVPTSFSESADLDKNPSVIEKTDENGLQTELDFQPTNQSNPQIVDNLHLDPSNQDLESESMNHETLEQSQEFQDFQESTLSGFEEPSMVDLPQYPTGPVFTGFNMLPQLPPINMEEPPPLPPLPPMQWRMGKLQNNSLISTPDNPQPTIFPQIMSHPPPETQKSGHNYEDIQSSSQMLPTESRLQTNATIFPQITSLPQLENQKSGHNYENIQSSSQILPTESSLQTNEGGNAVKVEEKITPQPPFVGEQSQNVSTSGDDERPNGIRPMKIQRPRTPLIDAVAAHDKSKLRKVSERARPPPMPKEEERDTLLEQIRAKSFNLKPAVQTRPSIQGPSTNLRVAAILEKANAIRQAFAGSDDDEDDDDSWSDS